MREPHDAAKRQLTVAIGAFSLPLLVFFGWFFGFRAVSFGVVAAILAALFIGALMLRARFKDSRLAGLGTAWLITGCLTALFWALMLSGFD